MGLFLIRIFSAVMMAYFHGFIKFQKFDMLKNVFPDTKNDLCMDYQFYTSKSKMFNGYILKVKKSQVLSSSSFNQLSDHRPLRVDYFIN